MPTDDDGPKRAGLGWIPKLSLWAVVIAFAFLYLSSLERGQRQDTASPRVGEASGAEAPPGDLSGVDQVIGKITDLTSSAGAAITDATSAGASGVKEWLGKIKTAVQSPDIAPTGVTMPEPVPVEAAAVQARVAEPGGGATGAEETLVALAPGERPAASGFERHYAPLPAHSAMPSPAQRPAPQAEDSAPAAVSAEGGADAVPVSDAESAVFAESLMREEPPPQAVDSQEAAPPSVSAAATPAPAAEAPTLLPVAPQPFPTIEPAPVWGWPPYGGPVDGGRLAEMQADYARMRREAEERARAYWERMPAPAPIGAPAYPGYGPVQGPAAFGPPVYPW